MSCVVDTITSDPSTGRPPSSAVRLGSRGAGEMREGLQDGPPATPTRDALLAAKRRHQPPRLPRQRSTVRWGNFRHGLQYRRKAATGLKSRERPTIAVR